MYCRECGNKLLVSDNFCNNCGTKVITNNNEKITNIELISKEETTSKIEDNVVQEKSTEQLPMNWWKFWQYFRLPIGLVSSIYNLSYYTDISLNSFGLFLLITNILLVILLVFAFYSLALRKKEGYYILLSYVFLETLWNSLMNAFGNYSSFTESAITFLIAFGILYVIWIYPNYIYFRKRKQLFCK